MDASSYLSWSSQPTQNEQEQTSQERSTAAWLADTGNPLVSFQSTSNTLEQIAPSVLNQDQSYANTAGHLYDQVPQPSQQSSGLLGVLTGGQNLGTDLNLFGPTEHRTTNHLEVTDQSQSQLNNFSHGKQFVLGNSYGQHQPEFFGNMIDTNSSLDFVTAATSPTSDFFQTQGSVGFAQPFGRSTPAVAIPSLQKPKYNPGNVAAALFNSRSSRGSNMIMMMGTINNDERDRAILQHLDKLDFADVTVSELKRWLRRCGMNASGKKTDLADRLQQERDRLRESLKKTAKNASDGKSKSKAQHQMANPGSSNQNNMTSDFSVEANALISKSMNHHASNSAIQNEFYDVAASMNSLDPVRAFVSPSVKRPQSHQSSSQYSMKSSGSPSSHFQHQNQNAHRFMPY